MSHAVAWHDVECGAYTADLPLWEELAAAAGGPVLDVGAGTGRVALHLAAKGFDVTALDLDAELLAELAARASRAGVPVDTVVADAAAFDLSGHGYGLVAVPMQTIQLLPGAAERSAFFACARTALAPGGTVALALVGELEPFEAAELLPEPDVGERDGFRYVSQPLALRVAPERVRIERVRHLVTPGGERSSADDVIELATVTAEDLAAEAAPHGLSPEPSRHVAPTPDHVGSEVVMLRG
jgi:SAM-dependent methyltransferase